MPYYAIAWGTAPNVRWGEGHDEAAACHDAYGTHSPTMTAIRFPRSPKYMSQRAINAIQAELIRKHRAREATR